MAIAVAGDEKGAGAGGDAGGGAGSGVVPFGFGNVFLGEQRRTLSEKHKELSKVFPVNDKLVTVSEAWIVQLCTHMTAVCLSVCLSLCIAAL
jgi:hypothetical protein